MKKITEVSTKEAGDFKYMKGAKCEPNSEAEFSTQTQTSKTPESEKIGRGRLLGRKLIFSNIALSRKAACCSGYQRIRKKRNIDGMKTLWEGKLTKNYKVGE